MHPAHFYLILNFTFSDEKESSHAVTSGHPATSSPANVIPAAAAVSNTGTGNNHSPVVQLPLGSTAPHSHTQLPVGLAWPSKLHDLQHGSLGLSLGGVAAATPHQHLSSSSTFSHSVTQHSSIPHFQGEWSPVTHGINSYIFKYKFHMICVKRDHYKLVS